MGRFGDSALAIQGEACSSLAMRAFLLLCLVSSLMVGSVRAQPALYPDERDRVDVIAIERDGRDLFVFDAEEGGQDSTRLDLAEEILLEESRGRVGVVVTTRRLLGAAPGTGWVELRLRVDEEPPEVALMEDRVALLVTNRRALAFDGRSAWVEESFSPNETATAVRVGAAVGVVTTPRRALGVAPGLRRFVSESLQVRESVDSVMVQDTQATLRTARRILVFSAQRGAWSGQRRGLRSGS